MRWLSHEVVVLRGNDLFLSPCSLSSTSTKNLMLITYDYETADVYKCTCSYDSEP
jgi:hypothetical protein